MENNTQFVIATDWITILARQISDSLKLGVILIQWNIQDNLFVMRIEGDGGKKVAKLFEPSELASFPLEGENRAVFEAQLTRLLEFFKKK
ncbi:MAG: hypothetical protein JST89_14790 [Cyanobacteria bacterium SZAS-4]|nr:hypothetical protein [Cyanobacteria bacterium SZAS-4]